MSCYSDDVCYCSICPAVIQLWNFVLTTPSQEFIFLTLENRASDYDLTLGYNCATKPNPRSIRPVQEVQKMETNQTQGLSWPVQEVQKIETQGLIRLIGGKTLVEE